ncbi:hypothetical protein GCM10010385_02050 [Streptomyces geysiriensis]|nr:hypothetical protein GCM10010385_02050 [Streptomyces geysiriensis]
MPTATRPVTAATSCIHGLTVRENQATRRSSGMRRAGAPESGEPVPPSAVVRRVATNQAATAASTAATRTTTIHAPGCRASRQSARSRLARTTAAWEPARTMPVGSSTAAVHGRAAVARARSSGTVAPAAVTSQSSAGTRDAAHNGIDPSATSEPSPQWVASRSGSRSRTTNGIPASTAVTPTVQSTAVVRTATVASLTATP